MGGGLWWGSARGVAHPHLCHISTSTPDSGHRLGCAFPQIQPNPIERHRLDRGVGAAGVQGVPEGTPSSELFDFYKSLLELLLLVLDIKYHLSTSGRDYQPCQAPASRSSSLSSAWLDSSDAPLPEPLPSPSPPFVSPSLACPVPCAFFFVVAFPLDLQNSAAQQRGGGVAGWLGQWGNYKTTFD